VSRFERRVVSLGLLALVSCGPETDSPDDTSGDTDTESDADTDGDTDSDTWPDTGDPSCDYTFLEQYVVDCGGVRVSAVAFSDPGGNPACPPYYHLLGTEYPTMAQAMAANGCDDTCVYLPFTSVMFLHCDTRAEFFEYRDGGPDQSTPTGTCDPILYFWSAYGSGWYPSLAAFLDENPCPDS